MKTGKITRLGPLNHTSLERDAHPQSQAARYEENVCTLETRVYTEPHSVPDYTRGQLVLDFMLGKLHSNPNSSKATGIRASLKMSQDMEAQYERIQRSGGFFERMGATDLPDMSVSSYGDAMLEFFLMNRSNDGLWDLKPAIRSLLDPEKINTPFIKFGSVLNDAWFPIPGIPGFEVYYDVWANIHYGYIGKSVGFDEKTLLDSADMGEKLGRVGEFFFGVNDAGDDIATKIGFKLWDKQPNCASLTAEDLVEGIRNAIPLWTALPLGQGSKVELARNNM